MNAGGLWQCLASKGEYDEAASVLQSAMKAEPNSRVCLTSILTVNY